MTYEWRPVVGYEGIYVVRQGLDGGSVLRVQPVARSRVGKELRSIDPAGYPRATLSKPGHKPVFARIHVLVMEAFGPPKPFEGAVVRHLNDNKLHNVIGNLAWGSKSDNITDAWRNGRRAPSTRAGVQHHRASVTAEQVQEIRASSETGRALADRLGINRTTISRIRRGLSYT